VSANCIKLTINGQEVVEVDVPPNTTLLNYLRQNVHLTGTKEGCAEGDCGACTVVVIDEDAPGGATYRSVNSCLMLLPMLHGRRIYTVEGLKDGDVYHPAQTALAEALGSQCGYCTPGFVMSMFEACYREDLNQEWKLDDQLCGNLCRCTGYRPIRDALKAVSGSRLKDRFSDALRAPAMPRESLLYERGGQVFSMPRSLDELWRVLEDHPQHRFVTGATDLGLDVTKRHASYDCLISLERLEGLRGITRSTDSWRIGATTPLSDIEAACENDLSPVARMLRFFGARQIKNRGTIGGNVCNASPIGDMPPVLMALNATMQIASSGGERTVGVDDFFLGYRKTALQPGEILAAVTIPIPDPQARLATYKVSRRRELDISAVCAAFQVEVDDEGLVTSARLAFGGMAAKTQRAVHVERALIGKLWSEAEVKQAALQLDVDFQPIADHRGSIWYRKTVARNLLIGFHAESRESGCKVLPERPIGTVLVEVDV
jgi:xanthine dehydrogenase small subunit